MGSGNTKSKAPKVTTVEVRGHRNNIGSSLDAVENPVYRNQLPSLRRTVLVTEAGPQPNIVPASRPPFFDITPEKEEASIIKMYPPRRLPPLEPMYLSQKVAPERYINKQEAANTHKAQESERRVQTSRSSSRKWQDDQRMKQRGRSQKQNEKSILEAQLELKRNLYKQNRINKQKLMEFRRKKMRANMQNERHPQDKSHGPSDSDKSFIVDYGLLWDGLPSVQNYTHARGDDDANSEYSNQYTEKHLVKRHGKRNIFSDTSSNDSLDCSANDSTVLHRTRAEKIPVYDEFFDQDF